MPKKNKKDIYKWPTISIIIVTKNVATKIPHVLNSIKIQDYPKRKLEIIAVDGGSTDQTLSILAASNLPITIVKGNYPNDQESRRIVGLRQAHHEIVAYIDADNYLPHSMWLKKMVLPFIKHPEIAGAFTLRYGYRPTDSLLNRYFALLGSGDPVDFYLGKGERLSYVYDKWNRYGTVLKKAKDYILVRFDPQRFPTLGANGFLTRNSVWSQTKIPVSKSIHVDVAYELALKGHQTYAIVDEVIIHDTASSFTTFVKKRSSYIMYYGSKVSNRPYKVFDPHKARDILSLSLFLFFSLTLVEPLVFAIRGFIKKRDIAWFLHPIYCVVVSISYTAVVIHSFIRSRLKHYFFAKTAMPSPRLFFATKSNRANR